MLAHVRYLAAVFLLNKVSAQTWSGWEDPADITVTEKLVHYVTVCPCDTSSTSSGWNPWTTSSTTTTSHGRPATTSSTTTTTFPIIDTTTTTSSTTTTTWTSTTTGTTSVSTTTSTLSSTTTTTSPIADTTTTTSTTTFSPIIATPEPICSRRGTWDSQYTIARPYSYSYMDGPLCLSLCKGIGTKAIAWTPDKGTNTLYACACLNQAAGDIFVPDSSSQWLVSDNSCFADTTTTSSTTTTTSSSTTTTSTTTTSSSTTTSTTSTSSTTTTTSSPTPSVCNKKGGAVGSSYTLSSTIAGTAFDINSCYSSCSPTAGTKSYAWWFKGYSQATGPHQPSSPQWACACLSSNVADVTTLDDNGSVNYADIACVASISTTTTTTTVSSTTTSTTTTTDSTTTTTTTTTITTTTPPPSTTSLCNVKGSHLPAGSKQLQSRTSDPNTPWNINSCYNFCSTVSGSKSFAWYQDVTDPGDDKLYDCQCISTSVSDSGVTLGSGDITYADMSCVTPPPVTTTTTTAAPNPTFSLVASNSGQLVDGIALQVVPDSNKYFPQGDPAFTGTATDFVLNSSGNLVNLDTGMIAMGAYPPSGREVGLTFNPASAADDLDYVPCVCSVDASSVLNCQCADKDKFATDSSGALYVYNNDIRNLLPNGINKLNLKVARLPL